MNQDCDVKSDAYYKFEDAINEAAATMRNHGWTDPLVAVIGSSIETLGRDFIVTDYGTIKLYRDTRLHPHYIQTMTETAYSEMLERERAGE